MQTFLALPESPVLMLNLLKFKPDGGAEEYAKYIEAVGPLLQKIGAKVRIGGEAAMCLIGNADWDMIALVEYPTPAALYQMVTSNEYQAIHHHRDDLVFMAENIGNTHPGDVGVMIADMAEE